MQEIISRPWKKGDKKRYKETICLIHIVPDQATGQHIARKLLERLQEFNAGGQIVYTSSVRVEEDSDEVLASEIQNLKEQVNRLEEKLDPVKDEDDEVYIEDVRGLDRDLAVIKNRIARLEPLLTFTETAIPVDKT